MIPPVRLRDAAQADLPAIVEIYNTTVASREVTADTEPVSVASRESWFAAHEPRHRPLWVIEGAGGAVIGWLSFQSFYGRCAYRGTAEISIYLAPPQRRRGLGRWLLGEAIARAPAHGIDTILGFIFAHNAPSLRLFSGAGFATWGNLPSVALLDGVRRDLLILGRGV